MGLNIKKCEHKETGVRKVLTEGQVWRVGFTTGIPWVQFSDTVPLPVNTVTVAGEGMTPYLFGYGVIPKNIKLLPAHHCVSLTVLQVVFSQPAGDVALCCAERVFLSCPGADLGIMPLVALFLVGDAADG